MAGGPAPSSCPGSDPEMLVTVSGNSGTINWCGETWTSGQSGEQRTVCPTSYNLEHITTGNPQRGLHIWNFNNDLLLDRVASSGTSFSNFQRHIVEVGPDGTTFQYRDYRYKAGFSTSYFSVGLLSAGSAFVTLNDYVIPNTYFGSYEDAGGVTYTWARGNGWP